MPKGKLLNILNVEQLKYTWSNTYSAPWRAENWSLFEIILVKVWTNGINLLSGMIKAPNCTNKSHQRELKYCTQEPSMLARAFYEQIMRKKDLERDPEKDPERPRESLWPSLWLSDWISLSPALSLSLALSLWNCCNYVKLRHFVVNCCETLKYVTFCCVKIYSSLWAKENCIFTLWANSAFYIVVWSGPNCTWPCPSHLPCGYQDLLDVTLACDDSNTPSDPGDDSTFSTFHWTFA